MDEEGQSNSLLETTIEYLEQDRPEELMTLLKSPDNKDKLAAIAWDMVPAVCKFLTLELEMSRKCVVSGAGLILVHLAEISNPKELLLVLLEQADTFKDDVKFRMLLQPIQHCLLRLPSKRSHSLAITLETLNAHIDQLPMPNEYELEGKEKLLLHSDDATTRIIAVVSDYLSFLKPLVEEVSWKRSGNEDHRATRGKQVSCLSFSLMKLLSHPMAFVDLALPVNENMIESRSRVCGEQIIAFLSDLHPNYVSLLLNYVDQIRRVEKKRNTGADFNEAGDELDQYNVEESVSDLALAVFLFLTFGELLSPDSLPCTYSHGYRLELSLPFIVILLQQPQTLVVYKGLSLLRSLLTRLPLLTLPAEGLEDPDVTSIIDGLIMTMSSAKVKELGQLSVKVLSVALKRFSRKGRSKVISYIFNTCKHSGIIGHVITLLKDEISESLQLETPDENFCGASLERLLKLVFCLPDGEKSDLLDAKEVILAALALLRFCVLRDGPKQNVTGIWNLIPDIQDTYCATLRNGINLSRAHYELEARQLKEGPKKKQPDASFNIGGEFTSGLDKKQQLHVMQMALCTFDMMESILGRVGELIDQQLAQKAAV